ncbi:hypothetical protein [Actinomadura parmotrematis]|uniref:Uncharacterized protein n=1 Tax=Actinomadura parmotrematis TaxID=2864039 RepID=A0ABS7FXR0_9ACTN|nr:hypothetical protein [Actinomadura parmotrematis]MBW8485219.1 hypothetical protein [Actinomadura parmotrematis]
MAWRTTRGDQYFIDQWHPAVNGRIWFRRLDTGTGGYSYRWSDEGAPDHSSLFGSAADAGLPGALANGAYEVGTSDDVQAGYHTLLGLTTSLAGRLMTVQQTVPALAAAAGQHHTTAQAAIGTALNRRTQAEQAADPAQGRQLFRQGLRALADAHGQVLAWINGGADPGAERMPLRSTAQRASSLGTQIYNQLQG